MGKSNYWTIWCPISQFVEHFDFLAHIYILLLQNKVRDNKSLNAGIQQAQNYQLLFKTRSSWLNCALRDDEAVFWVSIGHYEAVAVGNWWYWVSRGHSCLYILQKVEIWTGVTNAWLTDSQSKDRATQLLKKYKSGALVTQWKKLWVKYIICQNDISCCESKSPKGSETG